MAVTVHTPISAELTERAPSWPTPGWLRLVSVSLAVVTVLAGVVGAAALVSRQHATRAAASTAEPLVVDAQTVDIKMSDANTSIAGAFLVGPIISAAAQAQFDSDMAEAAGALTAAAQRAGTERSVSADLATLTTGLATYRSVVATAEGDNRAGYYPVAYAYLAEANNLMRATLLPAAASLYGIEQARLSHEDSRATSPAWLAVVVALMVVVLVGAVWMQLEVARRFRRVINVGLGAATVLVLAAGIWATVAASSADSAVSAAERHGTTPLGVLTEARILAQRARADDELTLETRDEDTTYQKNDYPTTARSLTALFSRAGPGWTAAEAQDLSRAATAWTGYQQDHVQVRQLDQTGQLPAAIAADGSAANPAGGRVDSALSQGVDSAVASFGSGARAASNDLVGLAWGFGILMVLAGLAIVAGTEPRIREYR